MMNISQVSITNRTDADVVVGLVTYPANATITLFDFNDIATYSGALDTMLNHYDRIKHLSTDEAILTFTINGFQFTMPEQFEALWDSIRPMTQLHQFGYMDDKNIYFDMKRKILCIRDPLSGKVYSAPMQEND